jgi:hypothetical protein
MRAQLWDPVRFLAPSAIPTSGDILCAIHGESFDGEGYDRARAERYAKREGFY